MKNPEKYNALGYLDLTAYYVLKKIEREEAKKRRKAQKKKRRKSTTQKYTDEGHTCDSTNFIGFMFCMNKSPA